MNCNNCDSKCCTSILPVSNEELTEVKKYIKENNIEPINRNTILNKEYIDVCPFLNGSKLCNIYPVRFEICKEFNCNKHMTNFNHSNKKIVNLLTEFCNEIKGPCIIGLNNIYEEKKKKVGVK